jgi:hypothetical protein
MHPGGIPQRTTRRRGTTRPPAGRQRPMSQLPFDHADVAMSALRDTAGRDSALLGLSPLIDRLWRLPTLPPGRRRPARLLRPGSAAPAAHRGGDPALLGGRGRDQHQRSGVTRGRARMAARAGRPSNTRSRPGLRRGGVDPGRGLTSETDRRRPTAVRRGALEPVGRRRDLSPNRYARPQFRSAGRVPRVTSMVISCPSRRTLRLTV